MDTFPHEGFTFTSSVTLNGNREWVVTYSADISRAISDQLRTCRLTLTNSDPACVANPPYIMKYGVVSGKRACLAQPPQSAINGINGRQPSTSWAQGLRTDPDTSYCIAMYAHESTSWLHNIPVAVGFFKTPPDPNPPAMDPPWWSSNPEGSCGRETTMALVGQCMNCRYTRNHRWNMTTNMCVNPGS